MNNRGNAFLISIFFVAVIIAIFIFIGIVYASEASAIAYNIKLDMYSINKSAIISVNKGITSREKFSYDKKSYEKYFKEALIKNYNLNDNLKSSVGLVREIEILQYDILSNKEKDGYTGKSNDDTTIHSVIRVKIRPLFNIDALERACTFNIHEDVALNEVILK